MKINKLDGFFYIKKENNINEIDISEVFSIVFEEESITCIYRTDSNNKKDGHAWLGFRIDEVLDFSLSGVLKKVIDPISLVGISILVVSSYDTDYIFVRNNQYELALDTLVENGFDVYPMDFKYHHDDNAIPEK
ncbi:ACT domain-containing protein [Xenorhabdus littoralis]|uniref:ACT domain-containing protein n=1 Tax=Xenorhabdus littoralis TaxID=2582835 RepID=UPI0029E7EF12|nr:ACT domain-containing protein [Xenorhabdus sp. psl]MDX7990806.1 ACT domain-containing protein [Xenorhabdus sp. psl]